MRILLTAAEVAPFAKVGGLADVAGTLPSAVKNLGHDIRIVMPLYGSIDLSKYGIKDIKNCSAVLEMDDKRIPVSLKEGTLPNSDVIVYFVANDEYFCSHSEVYPKQQYLRFEQERFLVFGKAVLELIKKIDFKPDIIHCNDWHTANIPVFLKTLYRHDEFYKRTATVFSIHNLAYQGKYSPDVLDFAKIIPEEVFNVNGLEFYGDVNWMKGGIIYSDQVNTVSQKYAQEIQTPEYGEGLDGLLRASKHKLIGILNGIDYSVWNPETDGMIPENYSASDTRGKKECKRSLQKEYGLPQKIVTIPLIGIVSRLVDQKGFDLVARIADEFIEMDIQMIVLGSGQKEYEELFENLSKNSKNIRASIGFDAQVAQRIYAGCDMFLMPSKFEPCGLGQLIALKYGTIPIVRATGGLADTVVDRHDDGKEVNSNGFTFKDYDSGELLMAVKKAVKFYHDKKEWNKLVKTAMEYDFSWEKSAKSYIALYNRALNRF
jgi:starch synthase